MQAADNLSDRQLGELPVKITSGPALRFFILGLLRQREAKGIIHPEGTVDRILRAVDAAPTKWGKIAAIDRVLSEA